MEYGMNGFMFTFVCVPNGLRSRYITGKDTGFLSQSNLNCTSALLACFMFDCQVDVQFERMLKRFIPLSELKKIHLQHKAKGGSLNGMALFTRARLSVQPLTSGTWRSVTLGNMVVKLPHHGLQSVCVRKIIPFKFFHSEEFEFVLSLEDNDPL
jgi:hypothetical protein